MIMYMISERSIVLLSDMSDVTERKIYDKGGYIR